jgi:hypothetical protein
VDIEIRCFIDLEVQHAKQEARPRVQARGGNPARPGQCLGVSVTSRPSKILHPMVSEQGKPSVNYLAAIFSALP